MFRLLRNRIALRVVRNRSRGIGWSALGCTAAALVAIATHNVSAQAPSEPARRPLPPRPPAIPVLPIALSANLTPVQSIAMNSTPLETRMAGTGFASVFFDPVTGDLDYDIEFDGIRTDDYTMCEPFTNLDGTPTPNMTPSGCNLSGGGLSLLHFHVGAVAQNGPIPIDIVAQNGPAIGVTSVEPNPIQMQGKGRVTGRVNVFDLAGPDNVLLNNVRVGDSNEDITDATCLTCSFIPAMLSGNVYVNIHTFNNPFGEIRGQLSVDGCSSTLINTLTSLRSIAGVIENGMDGSPESRMGLVAALDAVGDSLDAGNGQLARQQLAAFSADVVERSRGDMGLTPRDAIDLVCGASNLLIRLPSTDAAPPAADMGPAPSAGDGPGAAPAPAPAPGGEFPPTGAPAAPVAPPAPAPAPRPPAPVD